ncbi:hypothetical protein Bca4012_002392 [Brassica carinata]
MSSTVSNRYGGNVSRSISTSGSFVHPELESNENNEAELVSVSWNQDSSCFVAGTSHVAGSIHYYPATRGCLPFLSLRVRVVGEDSHSTENEALLTQPR